MAVGSLDHVVRTSLQSSRSHGPQPLHAELLGCEVPADHGAASFLATRVVCDGSVARRSTPLAPDQFGLFAERAIAKGETIFEEGPWLASQLVRNRHEVLACSGCLKFIGTLEQQVELIAGNISPAEAGGSPACWKAPWSPTMGQKEVFENALKCRCGEAFCSQDCLEKSAHRYLCVAELPEEGAESSPLFRFKTHALQTNELYLLAGKAIARMAQLLEGAGGSPPHCCSPLFPLLAMIGAPWWHFAQPPADEEASDDVAGYREKVKQEALQSLELLKSALLSSRIYGSHGVAELQKAGVLEPEFWGKLIGSFQMNNFGVLHESPLKRYLISLARELSREEVQRKRRRKIADGVERRKDGSASDSLARAGALEMCSRLRHAASRSGMPPSEEGQTGRSAGLPAADNLSVRDMLSGEDTYCPPLDGIGVFPLLAAVNHSCAPNAKVSISVGTDGLQASLVALREIAVEEEIVHSYIDKDLPRTARLKRLREEYGFDCQCARCVQVEARPVGVVRRRVK